MKKNTRKFLQKRISKAREQLRWIYIVSLEDERVYLTGDGFAIHLDWSFEPGDPRLVMDDCWVVPTSTKCVWGDSHVKFYNKLPATLEAFTLTHNKCYIEFAPYSFEQSIKHFPHEVIFIHVTPDHQVYFAHEDVMFKVGTINVTIETPLEETLVIAVSKSLIKRSYKSVDAKMTIDASRPEAPIQLGTWGERLAILMPMAISHTGLPKGLFQFVDDVADLSSDGDTEETEEEVAF